jgi:Tfp pilus assembly protein PilN
MYTQEGFESYDESTCLALAQKNESNIEDLKKQVDAVLAMQTKFDSLQSTTDANSKQLKSLVDQVYKT